MLEPHTHKLVEEEASSLVLMVSRPVVAGRSRSHFLAAGPIRRWIGCRRTSDCNCYHSCLWPNPFSSQVDRMQVRNATSAVVEQPALSILQPLGEEHHAHVLHSSGGRETQR